MSDDSSEPRGADSEDEWMPDERYPDSIEDKGGEEDEEEGQAEEEVRDARSLASNMQDHECLGISSPCSSSFKPGTGQSMPDK